MGIIDTAVQAVSSWGLAIAVFITSLGIVTIVLQDWIKTESGAAGHAALNSLMRLAARILPAEHRDETLKEWKSILHDLKSPTNRLLHVISFFWSAWETKRELRETRKAPASQTPHRDIKATNRPADDVPLSKEEHDLMVKKWIEKFDDQQFTPDKAAQALAEAMKLTGRPKDR